VHSIGINTARANVFTIQNIQPAKVRILEKLDSQTSVSLPRRFTRNLYLSVTAAIEEKLYTARSNSPLPLFLPVSKGVESELRNYYAIGNALLRIIPNGADIDNFRPLPITRRLAWRKQQGIPLDAPLAIFAGGEWARKGLHLAIDALGRMSDRSLWLYVAGDDPDRERFKQLTALVGVDSRVLFGGFRTDVEIAMASGDLFLFPSFYEAFSLATIEAAACGLPVVATKINGTENLIIPGHTGEFVQHDPSHIAEVLDRLCSDISKLQLMGRASRQRVEDHYTWDRVADMTEKAYSDYLALSP
jgi:UDP-glucose:(heptosyl)LPS alpha-1,3-glucosyltransferase